MVEFPRELVYVQKLHFLTFLCVGTTLLAFLTSLAINLYAGFLLLAAGLILSYLATLNKQCFIAPDIARTSRSIARRISASNLSARSAAIAASEMYYVLGDIARSEALLQAFLNSSDPFVHTTLAELHLDQGRSAEALACLEPVLTQKHPVVHWLCGKAYLQGNDFLQALQHLELALLFSASPGLPHTGTGFLNNLFIKLSVKASLLYNLADCYTHIGEKELARKHQRRANRYLIYPGLRHQELT